MADEDEIDILGDFSFNSCFAQNNQGIPSCSNREDTVHPQWLVDSPPTNWYDTQKFDKNRIKEAPSRKLSGNNATNKYNAEHNTIWSKSEREMLKMEMEKYGRNIKKISQTIKTKTEAEIQALIEAEHGIYLESDVQESQKIVHEVPTVAREVIVPEAVNMNDVLSLVSTGVPTIPVTKRPFKKKPYNIVATKSLLKPKINVPSNVDSATQLYYEEDMIVGSIESIESDPNNGLQKKMFKQQKDRVKTMKKTGNHRRKVSRNYDKGNVRNKSKDNSKSPQGRQGIDSSVSDNSVKSPKMQIVLGSGLALPVSEGEQVIKIEKKKESECESDIEIDIDSDNESLPIKVIEKKPFMEPKEPPIAVPLRKFEPMPKRNRKINLDGGGGFTIMHTESGDLYEIGKEPRKERQQRKPTIDLIQCRFYNAEKPAPCTVLLSVSALVAMDAHAHSSSAEVMGLAGGRYSPPRLRLRRYRRARALAQPTHCDMDPVSQSSAAEWLSARGWAVCGWHHSHPRFPPSPSARDLRTQRALQRSLRWELPCVALVTAQHWPPGRAASAIKCFRVEDYDAATDTPVGYQLSVTLDPDLTSDTLPELLEDLRDLRDFSYHDELRVNMAEDVCPLAGITHLEKCISSVRHHMHSAGYEDADPLVEQLVQGIRDIFR